MSTKEDAANNYARGRFACGAEVMGLLMDRIHKMVRLVAQIKNFDKYINKFSLSSDNEATK